MIAGPKLEIGRRHDLRLHAAHIAADSNRIFGRLIQKMVAPQPEN
jgi:hypothetical protein